MIVVTVVTVVTVVAVVKVVTVVAVMTKKELSVFHASSQSEAFPFLIAVILSLFFFVLNRGANLISSVNTLYSMG